MRRGAPGSDQETPAAPAAGRRSGRAVVEVGVLVWVLAILGYYYWSMGFVRLALQLIGWAT